MNTDLIKRSLLAQADKAFHNLVVQIDALLDSSTCYISLTEAEPNVLKHRELASAIESLGVAVQLIGVEVTRWKRGDDRVLSRLGVEQNVLNELYANAEPLLWFLTREEVDVPGFSLDVLRASYSELLRCNRLL
jgi:hypothetical protein